MCGDTLVVTCALARCPIFNVTQYQCGFLGSRKRLGFKQLIDRQPDPRKFVLFPPEAQGESGPIMGPSWPIMS